MTLANGLSLLRVALTPPLVALLLWRPPNGFLAATALFLVASVSDVLDGYFARRRAAVSKFGVFLDLVADKLLTASVLVAFVDLGLLSTWPVAIILGREFIITGLRTFAAAEGLVIPAAAWGKQKTIITNVALGALMLRADYRLGGPTASLAPLGPLLEVAPWLLRLAVLLTVTSGLLYVYAARGLFRRV